MRRAGEDPARARPPVRRAAAGRAPSRDRHRRAHPARRRPGGGAAFPAAGALRRPAARPRQGRHAARGMAAPSWPRGDGRGAGRNRQRTPARAGRLPRPRRAGGARARRHPRCRQPAAGDRRQAARAGRRPAPAGALRPTAGSLRVRFPRPARLGGPALARRRHPAPGALRRAVGRRRRHRRRHGRQGADSRTHPRGAVAAVRHPPSSTD